jgi:hypothetical protein
MHPFTRVLLAVFVLAAARQPAVCQLSPSMPEWLVSYPGSTPESLVMGTLVESTYRTAAKPAQVVEHYGKLFQAAGLRFQPNPDGMGTAIRGDAAECDLLILIREQAPGAFVDVSCAAKSQAAPASPGKAVEIIGASPRTGFPKAARPADRPQPTAEEMKESHARRVAELGIHPTYHDAPAPPLVWPSWLVHIKGAEVRPQQGVDQSRKAYLKARYVSSLPMTTIYNFYEDLLNSNEYRVHTSRLSTGQTISGVVQNAWGYVEGTNYPDGAPGPRTVIHVGFSRSNLNDPITVEMRITAYEFQAPKRSF